MRESGHYPHILKLVDAGIDTDSPAAPADLFEFGLSVMLDGIAVQLGRD